MINRSLLILILATVLTTASVATAAYQRRPFSYRKGAFATDLTSRTGAQQHNILRAGKSLDGFILNPGQTFSFNELAGPYTQARGFLPERSFRGEQLTFSPGGGVCQLSSTLYNAAKQAGLEILERKAHTQTIESVPPGWDATLAYGVYDLKLKNPHAYPIRMKARTVQNQLIIEIWGKGDSV